MLLRRLTKHVKDQNWFAVAIDIVIVVIGVFIGIQVANWNNASQARLIEAQYLDRFANELELTIEQIQQERAFSESSLPLIQAFTSKLYRDDAADAELLSATQAFFSQGVFYVKFRPFRTTFDDLITTGRFDIISDQALRAQLIRLHGRYDDAEKTMETNIKWLQEGEHRVYYAFDSFRFDPRTSSLFDEISQGHLANDVRSNKELLRRYAGFHYWLKVRSMEIFQDVEPEAQEVLELIRSVRNM